jgi:hypothetical protein
VELFHSEVYGAEFVEQSQTPPYKKKRHVNGARYSVCIFHENGLLVYIEILNAYFHAEERVILLND